MPRLFLGILPPADVRELVAARARAALEGTVAGVYAADDVHLTLVFLGDVGADAARAVERGLAAAYGAARPVALGLGGAGAFGDAGRERALWAGFQLDDRQRAALEDLVARGRRLAAGCGVALPAADLERPFTPHLTVARPRARERVPDGFAALRFDAGWTADEVVLFESAGRASGERGSARYPARARVRLAGS